MTTEGAARKVGRAAGTAMRRAVGVQPGNRWEDLMKEAYPILLGDLGTQITD